VLQCNLTYFPTLQIVLKHTKTQHKRNWHKAIEWRIHAAIPFAGHKANEWKIQSSNWHSYHKEIEREKKKERESAKDLPAAAIPFSWPAAFYSLPELEKEKQYVESTNVINYCTCNKPAIGQITHFHKCTLVL